MLSSLMANVRACACCVCFCVCECITPPVPKVFVLALSLSLSLAAGIAVFRVTLLFCLILALHCIVLPCVARGVGPVPPKCLIGR